jgi:hypothetical protein
MSDYPKFIGERGTPERRLVHSAAEEDALPFCASTYGLKRIAPDGRVESLKLGDPVFADDPQPPEYVIDPPIEDTFIPAIPEREWGADVEPKRGRGRPRKQ